MNIDSKLNFCRVFELPNKYPPGFCTDGSKKVIFKMVDWFSPLQNCNDVDWEEEAKSLREFCLQKNYVKPGKRYIMITEFNKSLLF